MPRSRRAGPPQQQPPNTLPNPSTTPPRPPRGRANSTQPESHRPAGTASGRRPGQRLPPSLSPPAATRITQQNTSSTRNQTTAILPKASQDSKQLSVPYRLLRPHSARWSPDDTGNAVPFNTTRNVSGIALANRILQAWPRASLSPDRWPVLGPAPKPVQHLNKCSDDNTSPRVQHRMCDPVARMLSGNPQPEPRPPRPRAKRKYMLHLSTA